MENKVKIAAGINTFNDAKSLQRTLESLVGYIDKVYIIDGRYPDYSSESGEKYSNDGTVQLAKEFGCQYVKLYADQHIKRTEYLKRCIYDFLFVIDADEYLSVVSWSEFQDQLKRYILDMSERYRYHQYQIKYQSEPNKTIVLPRLIYQPNKLMYTTHWSIIADPPDNMNMTASQAIDGITIVTDDNLRPITRLQYDIDYQWFLFHKEGVISDKVYNDTECKANFADHIVHEVNVWKTAKLPKIF